MIILVLILFCF